MKAILIASGLVVTASIVFAQEHVHPQGGTDKLGKVAFATSCAPTVQSQFERAVAMTHSFWFDAADKAFADVIKADSTCAMAYWGRAITLMGNPMTRVSPSPERLRQGLQLAMRADELSERASHREQMYVDALLAYFKDHESRDHLARMKALEDGLEAVRQAHSDDMEATIFYARTVVANASPTDLTFAQQIRAGELLQPLFDKHQDHPGLAHYLIHAYDAPATALRGARAAKAYADIAPDAPHALHMPSHIFTRLGNWDESIETNARSARAEPDSNAAVHPMDYMVYAYLQQGREREAKRVVDRATQNPDRFYGGLLGYNFAAMPARFTLERSAWSEAVGLKLPVNAAPWVQAITYFARGIGAARSGKVHQAENAADSLTSLKAQLEKAKDSYWATVVGAQQLAVSAWIEHAGGNAQSALKLARAAAELEETVEKHPVTPGPILPARELEGDLFMELKRPDEALVAYEKTLVREPRRLRALYGAALAAERTGNTVVARKRYAELLEVMAKADPTREEIKAARKYLAVRVSRAEQ